MSTLVWFDKCVEECASESVCHVSVGEYECPCVMSSCLRCICAVIRDYVYAC